MTNKQFEQVIAEQLDTCRRVLTCKAAEYATEDRLHNFRVAAEVQGISPRRALAGMMAKHTVSVYDMCASDMTYPSDLWEEKITDSINYLLLLKALVREETWDESCDDAAD